MKNRQIIGKAIAWISLAAILISETGCSNVQTIDITEKTNTERLENIAVVTMTAAPAVSPVSEEAQQVSAEPDRPLSPLYDLLGAPARYSVGLEPTSDIVDITVDADVILPETDRLPTLHVEPRDFTQDEVKRLFDALCGDTVMYKAREKMTRAEVEDRIEDVESEMKTATDPDRIKKLESNLAYWEKELKTAPEEILDQICEGTLEERQLGIQEYLGKYHALDAYEYPTDYWKGKSFHVSGNTYDKNLKSDYDFPVGANISYFRDLSVGQYLFYNSKTWISDETTVPASAVGLTLTPGEARKIVETFWSDNGFTDMVVSGVYLVCNSAPDYDYSQKYQDPYENKHAYVVACGRTIDGIDPPPADNGDPHWGFENCSFAISDNGIERFTWYSPYAYGEYTTENSALLPFNTIDEIFRNMMLVKYDERGTGNGLTSAEYHVDRIALEMSRVTNRKSSEKGLLIPVWNFYGSFYFTYEDGHNYGSEERQGFPHPLLRINAIDGSIIEPRYGC